MFISRDIKTNEINKIYLEKQKYIYYLNYDAKTNSACEYYVTEDEINSDIDIYYNFKITENEIRFIKVDQDVQSQIKKYDVYIRNVTEYIEMVTSYDFLFNIYHDGHIKLGNKRFLIKKKIVSHIVEEGVLILADFDDYFLDMYEHRNDEFKTYQEVSNAAYKQHNSNVWIATFSVIFLILLLMFSMTP